MSKRIYLSPSSQPENLYAVGNTNEQEQCRKIASALKEELERCGFWCYAGLNGTMYTRVSESDKFGVDLHMPIHTNACNGNVAGLRIMVNKMGGEAEAIAKAVMKYLAPVTPGTSDGISAMPSLYEIKATDAICVYLEVGFHDNPTEAKWIIDNTKKIAEMIARGLCEHYGVTYTAEKINTNQNTNTTTVLNPVATTTVAGFNDIPVGAYYIDAIKWAAENGIATGTDATHFSPVDTCTRGQAVTFLWRAAGKQEPYLAATPFNDVATSNYFYKPVLWAVEKNITTGMEDSMFKPNDPCTRGHVVTFLYRYAGSPTVNTTNKFVDVIPGRFYSNAVAWAVQNGITTGVDATHFAPDDPCTRAQIVTFLYRMFG